MSKKIKENSLNTSDIRKIAGAVALGELEDAENLEISDQFTEEEGDEELEEEIKVMKRRAGIIPS